MPKRDGVAVVFNKVLLIAKKDDELACRARNSLKLELEKTGALVEEPNLKEADSYSEDKKADLVICIGGDGTLLATLRKIGTLRHRAMLLGVHGSRGLGFLHPLRMPREEEDVTQWSKQLVKLIREEAYVGETRWGLEARIEGNSRWSWALNDFVIGKASISRMVELEMRLGEDLIVPKMRGDGVIVSSSTGSTAYSLSAGGPIMDPMLRALLITPVCSHTFGLRPMVLNGEKTLVVKRLDQNTEGMLTGDGQDAQALELGKSVEIRVSDQPVHFMRPMSEDCRAPSYFEVLRSKLAFGKDRDAR